MNQEKKQKEFDPLWMENTRIKQIIRKRKNKYTNERIRKPRKGKFSFFAYVVKKYNPFC